MDLQLRKYINYFFKTYNLLEIQDEINFKFIKSFPQISTPNYKIELYQYLRDLVVKNLDKINKNQLMEILEENQIYKFENINEIIMSNDFYGIDDILDIIFPNKEYQQNEEYIILKKYYEAKIPIKSIQTFENKLFLQKEIFKDN